MILNLTNLEKSEIKYKVNNYPDGQSDLQLTVPDHWDTMNVTIKSRFNSFKDLELILCATKVLRGLGAVYVHLYIPYILGARSDRKFAEGGISYLRDIIAPIINAQEYKSVTVIDPHSDVVEAVINNLVKIDNSNIVEFFLNSVMEESGIMLTKTVLVSPDGGALKKIYNIAKIFNFGNIIVASKHRDIATGNILSTEVPGLNNHRGRDFIIIDDICDGGRTFIEIAKKIKQELPGDRCGKIYLVVTHGIFSTGFLELSRYFDGIYTTNSVKDLCNKDTIIGTGIPATSFVKQLNVF